MESLSLGGDTPTNSIPRTFSFSRRSTSLSKSDAASSNSSGSSHGHHSLAHIFPHHLPHHLPKIFHKKEENPLPAIDTTSKDKSDTASMTSTIKTSAPRSPSLSSQSRLERHNSFASTISLAKSQHKKKRHQQTARENEMADWLSKGNVVYKSIGLGLTDLVVGGDIVQLARERGVGITIERF
jgi:hypothetical protein